MHGDCLRAPSCAAQHGPCGMICGHVLFPTRGLGSVMARALFPGFQFSEIPFFNKNFKKFLKVLKFVENRINIRKMQNKILCNSIE
jgi:hypothetical protein